MSNRAEIMAEIERLDGELRRITQELDVLRRKVEPARSGRTQAFPSPISSSRTEASSHSKSAPTSEIPATQPAPETTSSQPAPSQPVKTSTRTLPPSTGATTGRRVASPHIGLDTPEPTASSQQQRVRRDSPPATREVGRYGYVSDKPKGAQRR